MNSLSLSGNIIDVVGNRIFPGRIEIEDGKIKSITELPDEQENYILPGLIDAHIHIESSMLIPSEFARLAVVHGTVATVSDPHEIANVLGIEGVEFMIRNGNKVPFKFFFGASSCVPATPFETAGATLDVDALDFLLKKDEIKYLSEMMNFPGVLHDDPGVKAKLDVAKKYNKPIDGHAPGLKGADAKKYIDAGISTDHECFALDEALDKVKYGMNVQIREGSAAKNFDTLISLLDHHAGQVMFCSDDRHPNDLVESHVNGFVKRALAKGYDPLSVIRCCTLNPVKHYDLNVGLLQTGDVADLIIVDNLQDFNVLNTFIEGQKVAENGHTLIDSIKEETINHFYVNKIDPEDLRVIPADKHMKVIEALDGELITHSVAEVVGSDLSNIEGNIEHDILKIVVLNRYTPARPAIAFIKSFGLQRGAIASSVAHDSHNIIAVGVDDQSIAQAIGLVQEHGGGVSLVDGDEHLFIPLPVAGLMSNHDGYEIAGAYSRIDHKAKSMGSKLNAPFMTLSFMALLVIPDLKLSDKGLFDGQKFEFTSVFIK